MIPFTLSIRNKIETQNSDKQSNETVQRTPTHGQKLKRAKNKNDKKCAKNSMLNAKYFTVVIHLQSIYLKCRVGLQFD